MEFTGPYRDLLGRMYDRCVRMGWFGPESDAPRERASRGVPDHTYCALLSLEQIQKELPYLDQYEYTYDLKQGTTTIKSIHDRRLRHFGYPPATPEQIAQTEATIGFPLPQLLRDIYTQLANGGFGYWTGFKGVAGGAGGNLTVNKGTAHSSWKLSDRAPNGLVSQGREDVFKCLELPDRFLLWCSDGYGNVWIDGWSGQIYEGGLYLLHEYSSPEDVISDEVFYSEQWRPLITEYALWETIDTSEGFWITESDALTEPNSDALGYSEELGYNGCYGIQYEAPSLEAWIEKWLQSPLP